MWDEVTYPFPNFNGCAVEVWEWIRNFTPHFTGQVITDPCWVKMTPCQSKGSQKYVKCCGSLRYSSNEWNSEVLINKENNLIAHSLMGVITYPCSSPTFSEIVQYELPHCCPFKNPPFTGESYICQELIFIDMKILEFRYHVCKNFKRLIYQHKKLVTTAMRFL